MIATNALDRDLNLNHSPDPTCPPVAVQVYRGQVVESQHRAHIAVVSATGQLIASVGDPDTLVFGRSALKPLQASAMVEAGFLPPSSAHLAVAASSHSGEPHHLRAVTEILASCALSDVALGNLADWPYGEQARVDWIANGGSKTSLTMNCSGKHAAMLSTSVVNGWPTDDYLNPEGPLQVHILTSLARSLGVEPRDATIDGCGAPTWRTPLVALARGFSSMVTASRHSARGQVAAAMVEYPDYVGGHHRDVTELMRAMPGAIAKDGAEGVYCAALGDGTGIALKIEDGANRARPAAMAGVLEALGVAGSAARLLREWEQVRGGGRPVGEFQSTVELAHS